jgi:beta-glucosidase
MIDIPHDIDPNVSPMGSLDTNTTPDTEFSPPDSPFQQTERILNKRLLARKKLDNLTEEEKAGETSPLESAS